MIRSGFKKPTTNSPNAPVITNSNIVFSDSKIKGFYEKTINNLVKVHESGTDKLGDLLTTIEIIKRESPYALSDHKQLETLLVNLLEKKAPTGVQAQTLDGIHGIPNQTKTDCAFISILQLIVHTPTLKQKVKDHLPEIDQFVVDYEKGVDSKELHKTFNDKFFPERKNLSQEDIAEYLEKLLTSVEFKFDVGKLFAQSSDISIVSLKIDHGEPVDQLSQFCKDQFVTFKSFPEDLYFHLDRTTPVSLGYQDTHVYKDERDYLVPFSFNYKDSDYELTFVSVQKGEVKDGHYISYIKKEGQWYKNNDSTVEKITNENQINMSDDIFKNGCIYHYQKVEKSLPIAETTSSGYTTLKKVTVGIICLSIAYVALPLLGLL